MNLIALAGLLVWGWIALFHRPIGDYAVETDFYGDFVRYARELMHGELRVLDGFRGPLYYALLGGLGELTRDYFLVGKLLSLVAAAVSIRLAGGIVRRLWGPVAGVAAALFLAGNPIFAGHAFRASTDLVFLALSLGALDLMLQEPPAGRRGWAAAGLLTGLAWLTRYTGAVLVPAGLFAILVLVRPGRRALLAAAVFLGAAALVIAPWSFHLWRLTGDPFWNENYQNVAINVYASDPGLAQQARFMSRVGFASMAEVWRVAPARMLSAFASNGVHHVLQDARQLVGPVWAAVAVLGFAAAAGVRRRRLDLAFTGAGVCAYLGLVPAFYDPRFMIPLLPWWSAGVGGAAAAAVSLLPRLRRAREPKRKKGKAAPVPSPVGLRAAAWLPAAAILIAAGISNARVYRESTDLRLGSAPPVELARLAREVRATAYPFDATTPIAARKPQIGYLLGSPVIPIPLGQTSELRKAGARYLLVSGIERSAFPSLQDFTEVTPDAPHFRGLTLVARVQVPVGHGQERRASLFAVDDPVPWEPPAPGPVVEEPPVIAGLSRLDTLRRNLAAWYQVWDRTQPVDGILDRMPPSAREHPSVLIVRGDESLRKHRTAEADSLYRIVAGRDTADAGILLRRAGAAFLAGRPAVYHEALASYAAGRVPAETDSGRAWLELGYRLRADGEFAAAVAPLARSLEVSGAWRAAKLKYLGEALVGLDWPGLGRQMLTRYLELVPGDQVTREVVESLGPQEPGSSP